MSDTLNYQKIRQQQTRSENQKKGPKGERLLRFIVSIIIGILVFILIAEIIFHFLIAPRIALRTIKLETDMDMTLEEVKALGKIEVGELFHRIREQEIHGNLIAQPDVKLATVRRLFPDTLNIKVVGRKPLGILMVKYEDIRLPALIDEDGVVYRIGYDIEDWNVPIIQGIEFDTFRPGVKVHESYLIMIEDIRSLLADDAQLLRAFSEFYVDEVYKGVYEWILIPVHVPVRVRTSPGLNREKGLYILKILEVLKERGMEGITEIDFRAGDVVYNLGEGSDGAK